VAFVACVAFWVMRMAILKGSLRGVRVVWERAGDRCLRALAHLSFSIRCTAENQEKHGMRGKSSKCAAWTETNAFARFGGGEWERARPRSTPAVPPGPHRGDPTAPSSWTMR
jgi:hypothetical protein